jgi:integrase
MKRMTEIDQAKVRAEAAALRAEIARLNFELTEARLNPPVVRRGSALKGNLTPNKIAELIEEAKRTGKRNQVTDCPNLILQIIPGRFKVSATWLFRYALRGGVGTNTHKYRSFSLGQVRNVDVYEAREKALVHRRNKFAGKDPKDERDKAITDERNARDKFKTVNQAADAYFSAKISKKSLSHRRKTEALLRPVRAAIGNMPIAKVTAEIILRKEDGCDLDRMWHERHKSGIELRSHLHRMISYAKAMGWFEGENPAAWRDQLEHVLPKSKDVHTTKHHASMPYQDVPDFIPQLRAWRYHNNWRLAGLDGRPVPIFAVEMLILTGVRTKEVQRARYNEFDFTTMIWTVPGFDEDGTQRTKNGKEHQLPITTSVAAIVREMEKVRIDPAPNAFVFPGIRRRRINDKKSIGAISMQTLSRVLREHLKLDVKFVNHGFRTTLHNFTSTKKYPEPWWDIQVGHKVGDKVRQSYPLEQLMEERREMMQKWDDYCTERPEPKAPSKPKPEPRATGTVVELKRRA